MSPAHQRWGGIRGAAATEGGSPNPSLPKRLQLQRGGRPPQLCTSSCHGLRHPVQGKEIQYHIPFLQQWVVGMLPPAKVLQLLWEGAPPSQKKNLHKQPRFGQPISQTKKNHGWGHHISIGTSANEARSYGARRWEALGHVSKLSSGSGPANGCEVIPSSPAISDG